MSKLVYVSRLYGLIIKSPWKLTPRILGDNITADINIHEPVNTKTIEQSRRNCKQEIKWFNYNVNPDGSIYLHFKGLFEFLISKNGSEIFCLAAKGTSYEVLFNYLLGQAMSFAMLRKGLEPLHATTLLLDDMAVAFTGDCGYGKSTLAASFLKAGYRLLSDDLLITRETPDAVMAYPGFPRIKLFPPQARRFLSVTRTDVPMNSGTDKQIIKLRKNQFAADPYPLKTIYVLKRPYRTHKQPGLKISRLSKAKAYISVLKNTFNCTVRENYRLKQHFYSGTELVSRIPVKTLSYPRNIAAIESVRDAILKDTGIFKRE